VLRRTLLALACAALALGLVACGGVSDPLNPLALAADKSAKAGGVKMHMDAKFTVMGQSASLSADGEFDGDEGQMTMNLGDLLGQAGMPGNGQIKMVITKAGDHPVVYMQMPELTTMLPGNKAWIKLDLEQAMSQLGMGGGAGGMLGATGQSPADALEMLRKVASVTEVGKENVDGAETMHYHATIDIAEALEKSGAPAKVLDKVKSAGLETQVPVDVWIGADDGFVHKMHMAYGTTAGGQSFDGDLTLTFSDWGADVSIDVPSDDQTLDASSLLGKLGGNP